MLPERVRLLLVEDNEALAQAFRKIVHETPWTTFEVVHARSLAHGIHYAREEQIDLAVLDLSLPDSRGVQTFARFKAEAPHLPVVILTSLEDEALGLKLIEFGAQDYLIKDQVTKPLLLRSLLYALTRQQLQESLHEAQSIHKAIIENAPDVIYTLSLEGTITSLNPVFEEIAGWARDEWVGKHFADLIWPEDLPRAYEAFQRIAAGERIASITLRIRKKSGDYFIAELRGITLTENGRIVGFVGIARDITERVQREQELEAVHAVVMAMHPTETRMDALQVILTQAAHTLQGEGASISLRDPQTNEAVVTLAIGRWANAIGMRIPLDQESIVGHVIKTGHVYVSDNALHDPRLYAHHSLEGLSALVSIPLIANQSVIGTLAVGRRRPFREHEVRLLVSIAGVAAHIIHRRTLYEQIQNYAQELGRAYEATIEGWASVLELRDHDTAGHTQRVAKLTVALARSMGITKEEELRSIRWGALLHDIGKIAIPDHILNKPGSLDAAEWELMREHPLRAYEMLAGIEYLRPALDIPLFHHERWDGTGYPYGLKGEEIPLAARIFAVVDVWDAMRSERPYRPPIPKEKVLQYIREQAGSHFDPKVVEAFFKLLEALSELPSFLPPDSTFGYTAL